MRRFILILSLITIATIRLEAQNDKSKSNSISVSTTIVTKNKTIISEEKQRKNYDARRGYQQMIELGSKLDLDGSDWKGTTGFNYIGGYRFNNWIFAGVGIGLEVSHRIVDPIFKDYAGDVFRSYGISWDDISNLSIGGYDLFELWDLKADGSLNLLNIPLYVHLRGYYMRGRCTPYTSLSLGGILAPKDAGGYLDFSNGVDFRIKKDESIQSSHLYMSVGLWFRSATKTGFNIEETYYEKYEVCSDVYCPIDESESSHYHFELDIYDLLSKSISFGISARIGISF